MHAAKIIFKGKILKVFPSKIRYKIKEVYSSLLFKIVLEILVRIIRQEKENAFQSEKKN